MANFLVGSKTISPLTWVLEDEQEFARQKRGEGVYLAEGVAYAKGIHV